MFVPKFEISPSLSKVLMDIEACRQAVSTGAVTAKILTSLRESARLTSTHYSTQIEGNRLTQEQVEDVLNGSSFPNRKRDELEVKNYFQALEYVDELIKVGNDDIHEQNIKIVHGLVFEGKNKPSPYRDDQNVIRDGNSGAIVYMPPEAKDVANLMKELVLWIAQETDKAELPVPIIAGITHYQFATIHPYYDGNGRTARLLTNLVLHKSGYGLKGIYSLEEYYAHNLQDYYDALTVGESHNYYFGRAEGDITQWLLYFCEGMADAFANVRLAISKAAREGQPDQSALLRELDQRQKRALSLFEQSKFITTNEISQLLGIQQRAALNLCKKWIDEGFIIQHGEAKKSRKYALSVKWLCLI